MNQLANYTQEQFDARVQAEVEKRVQLEIEKQLSSREEAEARREAEAALKEAKETFVSMKAALEAKEAKIKEYEDALANLDLDPNAAEVAANEKIVELEATLEEWKHRATVAEAALTTLEREDTAAARMDQLTEAGVSLAAEAAELQYAKIRDMSDEEFEGYKTELVALKTMYASEEAETEDVETAELSAEEVKLIAQSLGCDPSDSKCISLVQEVAQKMSEVSKNRRKAPAGAGEADASNKDAKDDKSVAATNKEVASETLSLGDAISKSIDQNIQAPSSLKSAISQEWENYYAEKRGEKK